MHIRSMYLAPSPVPDVNFHNILFRQQSQAAWPDFTRFIDGSTGRNYGYRDFVEDIYDGATALGAPTSEGGLGMQAEEGEIVGIFSENCVEYISVLHALLAITVPFSLISSYATPFELEHALCISDVTRLFVHPTLLPMALRTASRVGIPSSKIYILGGQAEGWKSFSDMIADVRIKKIPRLGVRPAKRDTLAYLVFSSGTSGLPKAVMISHGNLTATILQMVVVAPPQSTHQDIPVVLACLPFYHTYGLHAFAFKSFLQPSTAVVLPRWNVEQALLAVPRYKITQLALIPSTAYQIVNYLKDHKVDLCTIEGVTSGAAHLPSQLARKLTKVIPVGTQLRQGYGMSECTLAAITTATPALFNARAKPVITSTGILLPGMEARIVREDGSDASIGEPGQLLLKGENIALGYQKNPKANSETFVDGWLHTGDRFWVDEHDNFFFDDRAKDTLKVSGAQVSPAEIEDVLLKQPDELILDVTVAGVSGGRTSDEKIPRAWIVLSEAGKNLGANAVIKVLDAWTRETLSKYKWLRGGFEIVDEIPKSPTGKVLRRVLQDRYEASRFEAIAKL